MLTDKKMAQNLSKNNYLSLDILVDNLPLLSYSLKRGRGGGGKRAVVVPPFVKKFSVRVENRYSSPVCFRIQV